MPLFTKDQLLSKPIDELNNLAEALNIEVKNKAKEVLVYDILDAQAFRKSSEIRNARARKVRESTQGEIVNTSKIDENEGKKGNADEVGSEDIFSDVPIPLVLPKRRRGRPSKADILNRQALERKIALHNARILEENENGNETCSEPDGIEAHRDNYNDLEKSDQSVVMKKADDPIEPNKSLTIEGLNKNICNKTIGVGNGDIPDFIKDQMKNPPDGVRESDENVSSISSTIEKSNSDDSIGENLSSATADTLSSGEEHLCENDKKVIDIPPYVADNAGDEECGYYDNNSDLDDFIILQDVPSLYCEPLAISNVNYNYSPGFSAQDFPQNEIPEEFQHLESRGVLEIVNEGYGFLRSSDYNYISSPDDIYVTPNQIYQYGLKPGDVIEGEIKIPNPNEKFFSLLTIERINGREPNEIRDRIAFEHLTPLFPQQKFTLCTGNNDNMSCRIVDLFAPIGKGQRALIVAQPKTGKTMLLKNIANAIAQNNPETYLMMLLIDERPEEVTDMARTVNAEVIASTFDEPASRHVKIASIVLEKAKRMVECGHDVVIFLDSITRLARAFNTVSPASGKVLTGGVDANALQKPKRFFGAARNIEGGGSLTIIATALIDTGSKMDEVIFEEFKGTGNMELQLDRVLANKRVFPAVNLVASSTRRDDLLLSEQTLNRMWVTRKYISEMNPIEAMTDIKNRLEKTKNNEEFLASINS